LRRQSHCRLTSEDEGAGPEIASPHFEKDLNLKNMRSERILEQKATKQTKKKSRNQNKCRIYFGSSLLPSLSSVQFPALIVFL